jgi:hypothetical protein
MEYNAKKITAMVAIALVFFSLTVGLLSPPKIQASNIENIAKPDVSENISAPENQTVIESKDTLIIQVPAKTYHFDDTVNDELQITNDSDIEQPAVQVRTDDDYTSVFKVTTDYGYKCTKDDPSIAIQNAIDSLPKERTTPCNVYLQGTFENLSNIALSNNINIVGKNATLTSASNSKIFIGDANTNSKLTYTAFEIEGKQYVDWISLTNVSFQNLQFYGKGENCTAIYFHLYNGTGWGVANNFNVTNCLFQNFDVCIYGLAVNSTYNFNLFNNYTSLGLMFTYGANLTITNNAFNTPMTDLSNPPYYGKELGLVLLDVWNNTLVNQNTFTTGQSSVGIVFMSSQGDFLVTANSFTGAGTTYLIDYYNRPFICSGITFRDNFGAADFKYDLGVYY